MTYSPISTWQRPALKSRGDQVRDAYWLALGEMQRAYERLLVWIDRNASPLMQGLLAASVGLVVFGGFLIS